MSPDKVRLQLSQFASKMPQSIRAPLGIAGLYKHVLPFYVAQSAQPPSNAVITDVRSKPRFENGDARHFSPYLRLGRRESRTEYDRKGDSKFGEASHYLITRSARASTFGGIVRPICLAVLRLMTNSNFFGCSTGMSPGLLPLIILSTYMAERRNKSAR